MNKDIAAIITLFFHLIKKNCFLNFEVKKHTTAAKFVNRKVFFQTIHFPMIGVIIL